MCQFSVAVDRRAISARNLVLVKSPHDLVVETMTEISDSSTRIADITGMIEGIAFQTNILANNAGDTMNQVTQAVARVTDIMGEIAAASNEQSSGIEQVNLAITQTDEVTQQNAALVEEAAAASKSLEEQGSRLAESVSLFRLEAGTSGA